MTSRTFAMVSNAENNAISAKDVGQSRFEPTKRPALYSIANRTVKSTMTANANVMKKVTVTRPTTRAVTAKSLKPEVAPPKSKPLKTVSVAKSLSPPATITAAAVVPAVAAAAVPAVASVLDGDNVIIESPIPMDISKVDALTEAFSQQQLGFDDADAGDANNPQLASEYVKDIYEYMTRLEVTYAIRPKFLEGQVITGRMRSILIDWLTQVCRRFDLLPETFYLTVNILDRYLQQCTVAKSKLQLLGITSLLLAAKYEEIYSPPIEELAYFTDGACTTADVRRMEVIMLKQLDFSFGSPLPLHFLRRASKVGKVDITVHTLAKYLTELSVLEYDLVHVRPSAIAAAALYLALTLLRRSTIWSETLVHYSKYTENEVKPIAYKLAAMVIKYEKSKLQAIRNKYASRQLLEISTIEELRGGKIKALASLAT